MGSLSESQLLASTAQTTTRLLVEIQKLTRVTVDQEATIRSLVETIEHLRNRLEQMEQEWIIWVTESSDGQPVTTPPGILGPAHHQLHGQGTPSAIAVGEGCTDPTGTWLEGRDDLLGLGDPRGHRDHELTESVWPSARQDSAIGLMPQPRGAPAQRQPGQEATWGGAELPAREVDLALAYGQGELYALSRDPASTRRPVISGPESKIGATPQAHPKRR